MLSHLLFCGINVEKGFSFLVIGKNISRLRCRYHFVLAALFSSDRGAMIHVGFLLERDTSFSKNVEKDDELSVQAG
ncbi:hypothetical protein COM13_06950 [Bacillus pseudomycoides]|uniref:Uncharacterized protein n=1 Tax=Bacillus pseudomycoides TaxID=64104 RepID=A0A1S9X3Q9_9BACI|nr:hypothetical protein [Bacillus pseudomycoides]MCX2825681.1 hypothetical protein [Bacillus sp. DHT2]MDR4918203.1 hypothetical protein [Bacillus pseudomycoides]MED4653637.1 hypothetical protein [Bacillus pseudomycoides]OOR53546.1 hypothetical protein BLX05_05005 [Bacillus pseudomycoides]OUM50716.1 hypothetical protein BW425_02030 [Bacillus pseudomycoides]